MMLVHFSYIKCFILIFVVVVNSVIIRLYSMDYRLKIVSIVLLSDTM